MEYILQTDILFNLFKIAKFDKNRGPKEEIFNFELVEYINIDIQSIYFCTFLMQQLPRKFFSDCNDF